MSDGPAIPASFGRRQMQPLDSVLDQVSAMPLDALSGPAGHTRISEARADREQVTALAAKLLDPSFRPLLEWLCDTTIRQPVFLPGLGPEAVAYCAHREGQNQVVYQLLRAAAEGQSQTMEPRAGSDLS